MSDLHTEIDSIVNDSRFAPFRGWHEEYPPGGDYLPAIQQVRSEFLGFVDAVLPLVRGGKSLQIGLGMSGAFHKVFEAIFPNAAWTIEKHIESIDQLLSVFPDTQGLICGDAQNDETLAQAKNIGPFDLLFIDGDHGYIEVCSDYLRYSPLVRAGGVVAFHDVIPQDYQVRMLVADLRSNGADFNIIGDQLGIGWFQKWGPPR